MKVTKEHKALNPTGKYPLLETKEGSLAGVVPICKFICKQSKKFLGDGSPLQTTQIDQWMNWTTTTLEPTCKCVLQGIFGEEVYQGSWDQASKDLKTLCKTVNTGVSGGFLVGGQLSLADIIVATALMVPF
jgi:glutathione S-transferase